MPPARPLTLAAALLLAYAGWQAIRARRARVEATEWRRATFELWLRETLRRDAAEGAGR